MNATEAGRGERRKRRRHRESAKEKGDLKKNYKASRTQTTENTDINTHKRIHRNYSRGKGRVRMSVLNNKTAIDMMRQRASNQQINLSKQTKESERYGVCVVQARRTKKKSVRKASLCVWACVHVYAPAFREIERERQGVRVQPLPPILLSPPRLSLPWAWSSDAVNSRAGNDKRTDTRPHAHASTHTHACEEEDGVGRAESKQEVTSACTGRKKVARKPTKKKRNERMRTHTQTRIHIHASTGKKRTDTVLYAHQRHVGTLTQTHLHPTHKPKTRGRGFTGIKGKSAEGRWGEGRGRRPRIKCGCGKSACLSRKGKLGGVGHGEDVNMNTHTHTQKSVEQQRTKLL